MKTSQFLSWLPPHIKQQHLDRLEGCTAVKFPAAYWLRVPKSMSLHWVLLSPMDSEGNVIKTGPDYLVKGLIKTMEKYEQVFETVVI